jgi:hypothetical protein
MNSKVQKVQEIRRCNAATPIPSKKVRKATTRRGAKQRAIKDAW